MPLQPVLSGFVLTFGTMTILAGVVTVLALMALVTVVNGCVALPLGGYPGEVPEGPLPPGVFANQS